MFINNFTRSTFYKYSAVVFDLSGTLIDFGVHLPKIAINNALKMNDVIISQNKLLNDIKGDNITKIKKICNLHSNPMKFYSILDDYEDELTRLIKTGEYTNTINQAVETTHLLKEKGIKIGIISNYKRDLFNLINISLNKSELIYDKVICKDDYNYDYIMLQQIIKKLNITNKRCLKIGQSYTNIMDGIINQVDTINVIDSSSDMNIDEQYFDDCNNIIKNIKRKNVLEKLSIYPQPKYYITSISEINKILK